MDSRFDRYLVAQPLTGYKSSLSVGAKAERSKFGVSFAETEPRTIESQSQQSPRHHRQLVEKNKTFVIMRRQ